MMRPLAVLCIALTASCALPDKQTVAADSYEALQMQCVAQYADKASIDRCRSRVKLAWLVGDAGADAQDGAK